MFIAHTILALPLSLFPEETPRRNVPIIYSDSVHRALHPSPSLSLYTQPKDTSRIIRLAATRECELITLLSALGPRLQSDLDRELRGSSAVVMGVGGGKKKWSGEGVDDATAARSLRAY